jgi:hypothetical protein
VKALPIVIGAVIAVAGLGAGAYAGVRHFTSPTPPVVQPLAFSHEKHVGDGENSPKLACTSCHPGVETRARAGLPSLDKCLECHMKPQSDSEAEASVRELAAKGGPFAWKQVTRNAGHVYFSHRAHVSSVGLGCAQCHGDVAAWKKPPERPEPRLRSMDACTDCHRGRGGPMGCLACHK